jgi:DNA-binding GntR family transcriptional regulator
MDHYIDARDRGGLREPHRAFHLHLVSATGDRGVAAIAPLFDHAERYRLVYGAESDGDWDARSAEHQAIVDAASAGDAQLTAFSLAEHYAHTAQLIFNGLQQGYGADRLRAALALAAPGSEAALDRISVTERAQTRK